ncbi:MAG: hypothetical protein LBM77_10835 [Spirochaetaceae bacterium]|jgi:hypothetical protein|nr:hypothetical protein [Spirochaetaceae bacterium]
METMKTETGKLKIVAKGYKSKYVCLLGYANEAQTVLIGGGATQPSSTGIGEETTFTITCVPLVNEEAVFNIYQAPITYEIHHLCHVGTWSPYDGSDTVKYECWFSNTETIIFAPKKHERASWWEGEGLGNATFVNGNAEGTAS